MSHLVIVVKYFLWTRVLLLHSRELKQQSFWFLILPLLNVLIFTYIFLSFSSGVSSFNRFIHEFSVGSDNSSTGYSSCEEDNDGNISPVASQSSRVSRFSTVTKHDRHRAGWIRWIFLWILYPSKLLLGILSWPFHLSYKRDSKVSSIPGGNHPSNLRANKKLQSLKDHIAPRTMDRRRGVVEVPPTPQSVFIFWNTIFVKLIGRLLFNHYFYFYFEPFLLYVTILIFIFLDNMTAQKIYFAFFPLSLCSFMLFQDLQLATEISIEAIFDVVHKASHFLLSPLDSFKKLFRWYTSPSTSCDNKQVVQEPSVPTATLGESDPTLNERNNSFQQSMNTDARTCQDVITELG